MSTLPPRPLLSGSLVASGARRFHTKRLAPASLVGCGSSPLPAGGSGAGGGSSPPPPVGDVTAGAPGAGARRVVDDRVSRPPSAGEATTGAPTCTPPSQWCTLPPPGGVSPASLLR